MYSRRLAEQYGMTVERGTSLICCGGLQFGIVMNGERASMYGTWLLLRNADEQERKQKEATAVQRTLSLLTYPTNITNYNYKSRR